MLLGQTHVQIPRLLLRPMWSASSMVSGKLVPTVSGKRTAKGPAMMATVPKIIMGNGSQMKSKRMMIKARMPPTLATVEQLPMAVLRMIVGNSSAVNKNNSP